MTVNRRMAAAISLLLLGLTPLLAQNQRLTWIGDEYTMRYEVIIEKEEEGAYNVALREFTQGFFIDISLPSGKYRYQVIPYDFLNQPIPVNEWMEFEVLSGGNTADETSQEEIAVTEPEESSQAEIVSTAPEPEIIIEYQNQFDCYLSATWISFLPIYGTSKDNFDKSIFIGKNTDASPFGTAVRLGIVSAKQRLFNTGMELAAIWRIYTTDSNESAQSLLFDCNMIQQSFSADDKTALNFRLGAGVSLVYSDDLRWAAGQQYSTHINIGTSLFFSIMKNLFLETGIEYSQLFTKDFSCILRSFIGLSYRF